jgi:hypothetical protein
MAKLRLPPDFSDFLKLLATHDVEYLLIGGYAVGFHGYVRTTMDMDVWIRVDDRNAEKMTRVLVDFGFAPEAVTPELFLDPGVVRMGVPPLRLEVLKEISGVEFAECYPERVATKVDGTEIQIISLRRLRQNKKASGRAKDLADLEQLPPA